MTRRALAGLALALSLALGWAAPAAGQSAPTPSAGASAPPPEGPAAQDAPPAAAPEGEADPAAPHEGATAAGAGAALPPGHGHGGLRQDSSTVAADLPPGTIEAFISDAQGRAVTSRRVRLGIMKQSIAEGNENTERFGTTDERGMVRFSNLERGSQYSYRITVAEGRAHYGSNPFNLSNDGGQRVTLHVYPVTHDIEQTGVAIRGIVYIEPRDDVFQLEVMFRAFNVGAVSWVPQGLTLSLPPGAKGFTASEDMSASRFVKVDERTVRLEGTFPPGQQDVNFRFQIPNDHHETVRFELPMPPRVAELQVMAESASGMQLEVDGFPPAEPKANQRGQRMLWTARQIQSGADSPVRLMEATLSGIPTPGVGRWAAVAIALGLGVSGLFVAARRRSRDAPQTLGKDELNRARDVLLDELLGLERAKQSVDIGPQTYESVRRLLLDALLRIEQRKGPGAGTRSSVKTAASQG